MKIKDKTILDWRFGYEGAGSFQNFPGEIMYATPHSLMSEPRENEIPNLEYSPLNEKDYLIYRKLVNEAYKSEKVDAMNLILKSFLYTDEAIDAYLWIAKYLSESNEELYQAHLKAYTVSQKAAEEYDKSGNSVPNRWNSFRYRPYMRAMASFYYYQLNEVTNEKEKCEVTHNLQNMIQLDTDDPMGLRFIVISKWILLEQYDQAEALYRQFPADQLNPLFLYPMAFMKYITLGQDHPETASFLQKALESNFFVPVVHRQNDFITDEYNCYKAHSEEEAEYLLRINYEIFDLDKRQCYWMYVALGTFIETFADNHFARQLHESPHLKKLNQA
jgi:hypothetical protein